MKKSFVLLPVFIFLLIVITSGCMKNKDNPEEIISSLKDLDSYTSVIKMQINNDKQIMEVDAKQYYSKGEGYRLELGSDRIMVYKKDKIYVKDLKNGIVYNTDKSFDSLYRLSFIKEYIDLLYTNEKIKTEFKTINGEKYLIIELFIPGANENLQKAELYINTVNNKPKQLCIFDINKKEKIKIIYQDFKVNENINKDMFDLNRQP